MAPFKRTQCLFVFISLITLLSCKKDKNLVVVEQNDKIKLGKRIFFDKGLSNPIGQSCSSCHSPETGFSDLNHNIISEGAVDGLYGNRNAPNVSYAMFSMPLHFDYEDSTYVGGFFHDGRVNSLQEQATKPLFNPLEMNIESVSMLISKVRSADYFSLYKEVYGEITDEDKALKNIADAIAAYEQSSEVNPFTSKFDYYLKGQASLTAQELRGMKIFTDTLKGKCANCHIIEPDEETGKVLFTDFTYDNIGLPKNTNNPYYTMAPNYNPMGASYIDYGLGAFLNNSSFNGQFKVPSLRNVAISAPYFHNGVFNTLEETVRFYNSRDSLFPNPEVPANVNREELGKLKLSAQEEKDLVAFLKTLTDGYK
ncbi:MAG: c-type cytochrome [Bacteroidetes bacterium]|nr:c-type cytochrome [Bacteroidota bacterium]